MFLEIVKLDKDLPTPHYKTSGSSGIDLYAAESIFLRPNNTRLIKTGIKICIPKGYEGQIRPRSGLALKYGLTFVNSPGTIDADFRGEIGVVLHNLGTETMVISYADRIAQLVICPVQHVEIAVVDKLPDTDRGDGGFGHTGENDNK